MVGLLYDQPLYLGVSKNASNITTRGDMGWVSVDVKQGHESMRLWVRLKNIPESRVTYKVHRWAFSVTSSYKTDFSPEFCAKSNMRRDHRRILARFRNCNFTPCY